MFKKQKILNVKYKSQSNEKQLLDQQFTIFDYHKFRISIENDTYYFKKNSNDPFYRISSAGQAEVANINLGLGKTVKLKQKDGSDIYFTLNEDFLYALNFSFPVFLGIALLFNVITLASVQVGFLINSYYQELENNPKD